MVGMRIDGISPGTMFNTFSAGKVMFVGIINPHPVDHWGQRGFALVIWWLFDGKRWSFDCLNPATQIEGNGMEMIDESPVQRQEWLHQIITQGWM